MIKHTKAVIHCLKEGQFTLYGVKLYAFTFRVVLLHTERIVQSLVLESADQSNNQNFHAYKNPYLI